MRRRGQSVALALGMVVGGSRASAQAPLAPGDPQAGRAVAMQLCASCHLVSPEQKGPVPDGVPPFSSMAARPGLSADHLKAILIKAPHPMMPEPPLTNQQFEDVTAYILSLRP